MDRLNRSIVRRLFHGDFDFWLNEFEQELIHSRLISKRIQNSHNLDRQSRFRCWIIICQFFIIVIGHLAMLFEPMIADENVRHVLISVGGDFFRCMGQRIALASNSMYTLGCFVCIKDRYTFLHFEKRMKLCQLYVLYSSHEMCLREKMKTMIMISVRVIILIRKVAGIALIILFTAVAVVTNL